MNHEIQNIEFKSYNNNGNGGRMQPTNVLDIEKMLSINASTVSSTGAQSPPAPSPPAPSLTDNNNIDIKFLCSLCYREFERLELVRDHMIQDHDCIPIEEPTITNLDIKINKTIEQNLLPNEGGGGGIIENEQTIKNDELLKPISLKTLKKKLKKPFTFKCTYKGCLYGFESIENRNIHEKCHMSKKLENIKQFRCMECQIEMTNWRLCSSHMWSEHRLDVDQLRCPFCAYKTGLSVQMYRHLQVHRTTKAFPCSDCSLTFGQFSQLQVHRITHFKKQIEGSSNNQHPPMRWYEKKKCEICGNIFSNSKILSKHIKTVHNKIKPFICNVCGHKSARKSTWQIHMRQHTGEKPHACKICDFRAADPSVLTKHEIRHRKNQEGVLLYKCSDCNYSAVQSSSYKTHLCKYHPNRYKSVVCDQCSFVSVNPEILRRHRQNHKSGILYGNEDSNEATNIDLTFKDPKPYHTVLEKPTRNIEISSDCFLPVESTDSLAHEPPLDTGGLTIPAHSEDTQFPTFS